METTKYILASTFSWFMYWAGAAASLMPLFQVTCFILGSIVSIITIGKAALSTSKWARKMLRERE